MKVSLLTYTPNPEKVIAAAARCCYSNDDPDKLMEDMTNEKAVKMLSKLPAQHKSVYEHVSFTFAISGVSRSFLAQCSRHRVCSMSVRSQRYCDMSNTEFVYPPTGNEEAAAAFKNNMRSNLERYSHLLEGGIKKEDARYVLPEATTTAMMLTMNARELVHFFSLRCCTRAQWEIRAVANEMVKIVKEISPVIFKDAGAACVQLGYCPEGKMTCGKAPTLDQLMSSYHSKE